MVKKQSPCNAIPIYHENIRSLQRYSDEFQVIAQTIGDALDLLVLTKINVHRDMLQQFSLLGYHWSFYTRDHTRGGGTAAYAKYTWSTSCLSITFSSPECLGLKMFSGPSGASLLRVYRPAQESYPHFLAELNRYLGGLNLIDNI